MSVAVPKQRDLWITLKNGQRLYAKQCGLRAFPLLVRI